jgi:hypothetical protein
MAKKLKTPTPHPRHARFGNWAQIASAVIALCGFTIVILQLYDARRKATEESSRAELADARKLYMTFSDATLKYPYLSEPDYEMLMHNHNGYIRYKNFVSHMLYAYDDILNAIGAYKDSEDEAEWVVSFEVDIEAHQRYLCQITDPRFFKMYRLAMQNRLAEANKKNCKDMQPLVEVH